MSTPTKSTATKPKTKTPGAKLSTKPAASVKTDAMATKVAGPVKSGTSSIRSTAATKAPLTGQSAVKKAPAGTIATPSVVEPLRTVIVGPVLRKKELIDTVVERTGAKKKDAKPIIEAMLDVLGDALRDNRELNLQPMGKFKVSNEKHFANGRVMRIKGRQSTPPVKPDIPDAAE